MVVAVTGSRAVTEAPELLEELERLKGQITELLHGGAAGPDTLAARWAVAAGLPVTELRPDYAKHGKAAPHIRNAELVRRADMVLACRDGQSTGTASTIQKAQNLMKPTKIVLVEKPEPPEQMAIW